MLSGYKMGLEQLQISPATYSSWISVTCDFWWTKSNTYWAFLPSVCSLIAQWKWGNFCSSINTMKLCQKKQIRAQMQFIATWWIISYTYPLAYFIELARVYVLSKGLKVSPAERAWMWDWHAAPTIQLWLVGQCRENQTSNLTRTYWALS